MYKVDFKQIFIKYIQNLNGSSYYYYLSNHYLDNKRITQQKKNYVHN